MSAVAKASDDKDAAPVWKHGPDGELGIGAFNWERFRQSMAMLWLPSLVLFFIVGFNWATFLISFGSIFLASRLARFEGTAKLLHDMTMHWSGLFIAASLGLLVLRYLANSFDNGLTNVAYGLGAVAYTFATTIYYDRKRLLGWEPPSSKLPPPDTSLDDLKAMREEIGWSQTSLASLPVFDEKRPELVAAWDQRDPPRIAHLLQAGNLETQESWKRASATLNRALSYTDRARHKLNGLLTQTEQRLAPFNINYQSIEVERSKQAHVEITAAIPKSLTVKRINAQNTAFIQGGSRAVAQGAFGQLPPLAAVAAIGISVVAHYAYKSRTLRRLKDAQGQLLVNAQAARGDFTTLDSIFATRLIPQFDGMISVAMRLESGLADLKPETMDSSDPAQRDKALQLAFALIEGKKLVSTTAGD